MTDETSQYKNLFLKVLPARDRALLEPSLQFVELKQGEVLNEPGAGVSDVVFLEAGMISLLTGMLDGSAIEIATLGRESILGVLSALGNHRSSVRGVTRRAPREGRGTWQLAATSRARSAARSFGRATGGVGPRARGARPTAPSPSRPGHDDSERVRPAAP